MYNIEMETNLIFAYLVTMCCFVSEGQLNTEGSNRLKFISSPSNKQRDERWSWGYADMNVTGKTRSVTTEPTTDTVLKNNKYENTNIITTTNKPANPCSPFVPPQRNFSAPGRRISVVKCYEFLWHIKIREDESRHQDECFSYKLQECQSLTSVCQLPVYEIGGRDTGPGEFPHMGAIGWKASIGTWLFKCGSSLISDKFVLTAAHCSSTSSSDTSVSDPIPRIVRLGDKNILDLGIYQGIDKVPYDNKIIKIITHPQYAAPKKYFDIALMELENPVFYTKHIQPACLWNKFDVSKLGKEATSTGWGVIEADGSLTSPELQAATIDIIDSEQCNELLRNYCNRHWCGVREHQICAGKLAGGVDACQGDSGGPLQVKIPLPTSTQGAIHYVIGVTSFGIECALPNLPGIYTRVSSFIDWIEDIVWRNN